MLFLPSCREFNSLQKRYTALLHRTNTFFIKQNHTVGGKVDCQILFGARSEKPKILFGAKWQLRKMLFLSQRVNIIGCNNDNIFLNYIKIVLYGNCVHYCTMIFTTNTLFIALRTLGNVKVFLLCGPMMEEPSSRGSGKLCWCHGAWIQLPESISLEIGSTESICSFIWGFKIHAGLGHLKCALCSFLVLDFITDGIAPADRPILVPFLVTIYWRILSSILQPKNPKGFIVFKLQRQITC